MSLAIISTHPVQYRAPVYRALRNTFDIDLTVVYGSDMSVAGYKDKEFGTTFSWDSDLLSGYQAYFLSRTEKGSEEAGQRYGAGGVARAMNELKPAAVLIEGYAHPLYRQAFREAARAHCSVMFRAETTDHAKQRSMVKRWLRDRYLKGVYARCDTLLYIGEYSRRHYERLGCPAGKLVFSPYGVDTASFQCGEEQRSGLRKEVRASLGARDEEIVFLFSGKLVNRKGPDLLVSAVRALGDDLRRRCRVLFLGSGGLQGRLQAHAQREPAVRVHFAGFRNQTQMSRYYHGADLLVLPSRHSETWGLVVNEALHHGLPCVVSDAVGCTPDLIETGVTGEICVAASAQSLAEALRRSLDLAGREDIRRRCREKAGAYTIEDAAAGIAKAYRALIGNGAGRGRGHG